jgi:ligand-binding SRPBCC domain-containing protein
MLQHETQIRVGGETWIEETVAGFVPVVLGFRHIVFEKPVRFGEELIHGPFSRFVHLHEFEDQNGLTRVRDRLEVEWPWQYGGSWVMERIIAGKIRRMFRCREAAMGRLAHDGTILRSVERQRQKRPHS